MKFHIPHRLQERSVLVKWCIKAETKQEIKHTFLGLLAKIKCSICSYQFNI